MATIRLTDFGGIAPGVSPFRLPANGATIAHNCRLKSGRLEPLTEPTTDTRRVNFEGGLSEIKDAKSLYLWNKGSSPEEAEWIAWAGRVSVAPSNLAVDANRRLFVTGETGYDGNKPVMFFAGEIGYTKYPIIKTAFPKPTAETVEKPSEENTLRYTNFFVTWVDAYGYESPVSEPSEEVSYNDGQLVKINEFLISDTYRLAMKRRVYKVVTGSEGESIQFIAEQERVGLKFLDFYFNVKDEDAGEVLAIIEAPPETLGDILWMPGGFYAGVDRANSRTVCFSDINLPYSWPTAFQYTVKDDIVGIALVGNTLVVLTTGSPWVISGTAPESMSVTSLASPYACVSEASICTLGATVYYASHSGICAITEGSNAVALITTSWFTREAWEAIQPETVRMVAHDSALFLWADGIETSLGARGLILDFMGGSDIAEPAGNTKIKAITTHDERAGCVFEDIVSGNLCYVRRVS